MKLFRTLGFLCSFAAAALAAPPPEVELFIGTAPMSRLDIVVTPSNLRPARPTSSIPISQREQWIPLRAQSDAVVTWSSDSLPIDATQAQLREGRHVIHARLGKGESVTTWIDVKAL